MTGAPAVSVPPVGPHERNRAVDVARALAVVLGVVANHTIDGMVGAGTLAYDSTLARVNHVGYLIYMPALAFLLGLFVPAGVADRGARGYLVRRVVLVVWLYVVWYVLQGLVEVAANGVTNAARPASSLLRVWHAPDGQLWFLPFLAVASVVLVLTRPWASHARSALVLPVLLATSAAAWGWNPDVVGARGLSLLVFAGAGAALGLARAARLLAAGTGRWTAVGAGALAGFLVLLEAGPRGGTFGRDHADAVATLAGVLAGALGIVVLLAAGALISRAERVGALLGAIGAETLPVFLGHLVVVAGVRIVATHAGLGVPPLVLIFGVLLGTALPITAHHFARSRWWLSWLFAPPQWPEGRGTTVPDRRPRAAISSNRSGTTSRSEPAEWERS